jgi:hypothetical protein
MNLYDLAIPQFTKMIANLDRWLESAAEHATKKPFDAGVLVAARLAPDQYPLSRQVQSACDGAKFTAARLTGKEAPKHPDTEQTIDELRARTRTVRAYLETFKAEDFAGAETRAIDIPWAQGKFMHGREYLLELALPNFFFHVVHAYAILRHNGVPLGKRDYLGSVDMKSR